MLNRFLCQVQIGQMSLISTTLHIFANLSFDSCAMGPISQSPQDGGATSLIPRLTETGKLGGDAENPLRAV